NFVLMGAAILAYNLPVRSKLAGQICVIAAMINAFIAMNGYVFSASQAYGLPFHVPTNGMTIQTAIGFIILAVALLCSRPDEGVMSLATSDTRTGGMTRRILWVGILTPPLAGALTRIGVLAGWYDVGLQVSLFSVIIVSLILWATFLAASLSEQQ